LDETEPLAIRSGVDGIPGRMWVDYCSGLLQVFINTNGDEKPATPQASTALDLNEYFEGNDVVVGYTSGTWGAGDNHDILDWTFVQGNATACAI
jgi:hypothetical protein